MKHPLDNKTVDWVDFQIGDLIVHKDSCYDQLLKIDAIFDGGDVGYKGAKREFMSFQGFANPNEIRLATEAERAAGKRLGVNP